MLSYNLLLAQTVFKHSNPQSAVYHQPESPEERLKALQALLSCPTSSIHTERPPKDIKQAHDSFPIPVDADEIQATFPQFKSQLFDVISWRHMLRCNCRIALYFNSALACELL